LKRNRSACRRAPILAVAPAALLALALVPRPARAEASVSVNGYASGRLEYTAPRLDVTLAAFAVAPEWRFLLEGNVQLRLKYSDRYDLYADASAFYSNFIGALDSSNASLRHNTFLVNELYQNFGFHEHLTGLAGKKRVIWGTGFAWNPADILNVAKDPTDPALQRVGAWLAELEVPFARWTVSALFAPEVLATEAGLPRTVMFDADDHAHYLLGARAYALLLDSDVTLMYYFTDRYADALRHRSHFGASFARYFFTDYELHFEGLAHLGSTRAVVNPDCLGDPGVEGDEALALLGCVLQDPPAVMAQPDLDQKKLFVRFLVGTRYTFKDSSLLSVEYYYNGEGLTRAEFADRTALFDNAAALLAAAPPGAPLGDPAALLGGGGGGEAGTPARVRFEPARRHYLFISYMKPQIRDDFTWMVTLIAGLEDLSVLAASSLTWSAKEWLQFVAFVSVPLGTKDSEFGALPQWARLSLEAKVFY
jgi:hypothetical protein